MGPLPPNIARHIALYGSRLLHGQENLWKTTWQSYGRLNVNLAIWNIFMNTTLRAAVHLGKDYDTNLHYAKNHLWDSLGQLFCEIKRLISEQSENPWSNYTGDRWFENN